MSCTKLLCMKCDQWSYVYTSRWFVQLATRIMQYFKELMLIDWFSWTRFIHISCGFIVFGCCFCCLLSSKGSDALQPKHLWHFHVINSQHLGIWNDNRKKTRKQLCVFFFHFNMTFETVDSLADTPNYLIH